MRIGGAVMAMNYSFQGVYKELLTGYVEEKYALGLKFTAQVRRLKQFDQLSFSFSCLYSRLDNSGLRRHTYHTYLLRNKSSGSLLN